MSNGKDRTAGAYIEEGIYEKPKEAWVETQWPACLQGPESLVSCAERIRET